MLTVIDGDLPTLCERVIIEFSSEFKGLVRTSDVAPLHHNVIQ